MILLHETFPIDVHPIFNVFTVILIAIAGLLAIFMTGLLPIPVGYDRGKVKFLMWCGTGMHAHHVYYHEDAGLQSIHPEDLNND